jgi:hypothetical protein
MRDVWIEASTRPHPDSVRSGRWQCTTNGTATTRLEGCNPTAAIFGSRNQVARLDYSPADGVGETIRKAVLQKAATRSSLIMDIFGLVTFY